MAVITMRIDDADAFIVQRCARLEGKTVSDFVRDIVFERVERMKNPAVVYPAVVDEDSERLIQYQVLAELRLS